MMASAALGLIFIAIVVIAALAYSETSARYALLLALLLLPLPSFVNASDLALGLLSFLAVVSLAAAIDFATARRPRTFMGRFLYLWAFAAFADTFPAARRPRSFDARAALRSALSLPALTAAIVLWIVTAPVDAPVRYLLRSGSVALLIAAAAEFMTGIVLIISSGLGFTIAPPHNAPYRSRTVTEFWSRRWNLMTGRWLREHCFVPLRLYGLPTALFATFAASAALHAYLILAIGDVEAIALWTAFFLAQPLLILIERLIFVRRWHPLLGRVWTIAMMLIFLPLLFVPVLPALGLTF